MRIAPTRVQFAHFPGECLKPKTRWRRDEFELPVPISEHRSATFEGDLPLVRDEQHRDWAGSENAII